MRTLAILLALCVASTAHAKPRKVAVVLYEGAEILDFSGPLEVFSAAGHRAGDLEVYTVARTTEPITAQGIVKVTPNYSIANAPRPDLVVIPGGNSDSVSDDPAMMKWLGDVTATSDVTLTVCTGAFPIAKLGALDGLEVTTFYGAIDGLRKIAPRARVTDGRRFIDNGRYVTTAGVSAGIDGALHVVARLYGRQIADATARYMEYHWSPEPYLAKTYSYWNPSTDDRGRAMQAAQAALDEGRADEGIAAYRKLAATDRDGVVWDALGHALLMQKDHKGALAAYSHVPASSKLYAKATYNAACANAVLGNTRAAIDLAQKALAAGFPKDYALHDPDLAAIRDQLAKR